MIANVAAQSPPSTAAVATRPVAPARVASDGAATLTPDLVLIAVLIVLCLFGTVLTFSASYAVGIRDNNGDGLFYFRRTLVSLGIGLAALLLTARVDYHFWRRFSVPAMAVTGVMLFVVLLVGQSIGGAKRWFDLGPIQMQPAEVMKFVLTLYMADLLDRKGSRIRDFMNGAVPFGLTLSVIAFLVMLEPDLGTTTVLVVIGFSIFLVAGGDLRQFSLFLITGVLAFIALAFTADYRRERLFSFLQPDRQDLRDAGWQLWQARIALGNGGIFGQGLGASRQKFSWLPAAHTDAIIAVVGEELGLIGCVLILALFALLAVRGYRCALRAPDRFGAIMATGITSWVCFQAVINIGGVTTAIPFTGVPLPFFSYGGSNLAVTLGTLGVLINISRQGIAYAPPKREPLPPMPALPARFAPSSAPYPDDPDNALPPAYNGPQLLPHAQSTADAAPTDAALAPPAHSQAQAQVQRRGVPLVTRLKAGKAALHALPVAPAPPGLPDLPDLPDLPGLFAPAAPSERQARRTKGEFVTRIPVPRPDHAAWDDGDDGDDDTGGRWVGSIVGDDVPGYGVIPPTPRNPPPRSADRARPRPGKRDGSRPAGGAIVTRLDPAAVRDE